MLRHSVLTVLTLGAATLTALPTSAAAEDGQESELDATLRDALCRDRDPCHLEERRDADVDADGRQLSAQKLRLSDRKESPPLPTRECIPYEWWLVRMDSDEVDRRQLLVDICNKGHGAAGVGEDDVTVQSNRFRHIRRGGSAWRWSIRHTVELSPLRILETRQKGFWGLGPNRSIRQFDWTTFRGRTNWYAPVCNPKTDPDPRPDASPPDKSEWLAFEPIPGVEADDEFLEKEWKNVALGSCALELDSRGNQDPETFGHGFVTHGEPGAPDDAQMRVLSVSDKTVVVEIEDDTWIEEGDKWVHTDHVEIWVGSSYTYMDHCRPKYTRPDQWGILLDGGVEAAYGDPEEQPDVEVVDTQNGDGDRRVRMKIKLPEKPEAITVVYSDSDDGSDQKRLLATSKLEYGDAASLGRIKPMDSDAGSCTIDDGEYEFEPEQSFEPEKPVVDW